MSLILKHSLYTAVVACILALATGCTHKELSDGVVPKVRVRVAFDWSMAPDASPLGMTVFFYNADRGVTERFDFSGVTGGIVDLPTGNWHVISYNNDTEGIIFAGMQDYTTHTLFTRDGNILEGGLGNGLPIPPRAEGSEDEPVVITPDMIWGHNFSNHQVAFGKGETEHTVTVTPQELVCHYDFEIRNVDGLQHVARMCAAISGMSGSLTLHGATLGDQPVTLPLPAYKKDDTTIRGEFLTFGHHGANAKPHCMTLYLWMDDGRKLAYGTEDSPRWNVTEQVDNAPDPRHVHIVIDGLDVPVPIDDGMFRPSTDGWDSEEHDVGV